VIRSEDSKGAAETVSKMDGSFFGKCCRKPLVLHVLGPRVISCRFSLQPILEKNIKANLAYLSVVSPDHRCPYGHDLPVPAVARRLGHIGTPQHVHSTQSKLTNAVSKTFILFVRFALPCRPPLRNFCSAHFFLAVAFPKACYFKNPS